MKASTEHVDVQDDIEEAHNESTVKHAAEKGQAATDKYDHHTPLSNRY